MRRIALLSLALSLAAPARALSVGEARSKVQARTLDYLGIPYLWGGADPDSGLDCSGFTQLVFERTGLALPRGSREQFAASRSLAPREVLAGDLVFFDMKSRGRVDHVGVYLGKGYFIHASYSQGVTVDRLDKDYWLARLVAIRRPPAF